MTIAKYKFDLFSELGLGSHEAQALSEKLSDCINQRLHVLLSNEMQKIVKELNEVGHDLKEYYEPIPGDISFRDDSSNGSYECKLRVGIDTIVSVGFGDVKDE